MRFMDLLRVRQLRNQPRRLPYRLKHRLSLFNCIGYQPIFVLKWIWPFELSQVYPLGIYNSVFRPRLNLVTRISQPHSGQCTLPTPSMLKNTVSMLEQLLQNIIVLSKVSRSNIALSFIKITLLKSLSLMQYLFRPCNNTRVMLLRLSKRHTACYFFRNV